MLLEVEYKEHLYFHRADDPLGPELREAITDGDGQALPTLLNTARMASDSDLTFWGDAANGAIEIEWHIGATGTGFNLELPVGEGVGGRAFARREAIHVDDYLNSKYRHPDVRDDVDKQGARTVLSVPLSGRVPGSGAVLYGARRRVSRFTAAQRVLLLRLARSVEPLIGERPVSRYFFPSDDAYLAKKRSELRRILTRSSKVQDLESWVEKFARGPAIVTNAEGRPYAPSRTDRFEELRCSPASIGVPRTVALAPHGEVERGHLHVWSTVSLPPAGWPDFLDDVAAACNVVLDRAEQTNDRLSSLRTNWLEEVMRSPTAETCREGRRLGLPVDGGGVWALAWAGGEEAAGNANRAWAKLVAQEIALDKLGSPLILTNGAVGVFLLDKPARGEPSAVRDALLEALEPAALWLVHGAVYDSFEGLQGSLLQAVTTAKGLRQDNDGRYVSDVGGVGLRSLLAKPELSEHLESFTDGLLAPLLAYDSETGSRLTETLALVLTVGSHEEVARRLNVHPKTIGYRTRRAEEILEKDLGSPTDKIALGMAAFVWANSQRSR
ncbi:GAF domain-containing protein [Rubrobacter marinus]|nr:GAF domain-containing protein [Rubrobacter marinus]